MKWASDSWTSTGNGKFVGVGSSPWRLVSLPACFSSAIVGQAPSLPLQLRLLNHLEPPSFSNRTSTSTCRINGGDCGGWTPSLWPSLGSHSEIPQLLKESRLFLSRWKAPWCFGYHQTRIPHGISRGRRIDHYKEVDLQARRPLEDLSGPDIDTLMKTMGLQETSLTDRDFSMSWLIFSGAEYRGSNHSHPKEWRGYESRPTFLLRHLEKILIGSTKK